MKIGLLTYHHSVNNGAMLQAYATARALKELGHDVVFVDIRQPEPKREGVVGMIIKMIYYLHDCKVRRFKNKYYPKLTRHYETFSDLKKDPPIVDCLVVGSDQVWNPDIARDMLLAYFLDFGRKEIKRVSYASSFGISQWDSTQESTIPVCNALKLFQALSVREKTGAEILKNTFGLDSAIVVDPTMLFDNYSELTGSIPQTDEVVCYKLNRTIEFYNNIRLLKKITKSPIRLLNNSYPVKGLRYTYPPGVEEWIRKIAGAKYVITDSFHGVVFSILYKRNFVVIKNNNGKDSRMLDLLSALGLSNRVYDSIGSLLLDKNWLESIDYKSVSLKVESMRQSSWDFLKKALN